MFKRIYIFIIAILLCIGAFCYTNKEMQNDVYFTIPTGNYILENGIDEEEPLTYHNNLKYTKLRYGFDIVVAEIYNHFDFDGLYVFSLIITMTITLSLFYITYKIAKSPTISAILVMIVLLNVCDTFTVRAQIISYLIYTWAFYFMYMLWETKQRKYSIALIILSILLLMFHSSVWILYPVLFLPFVIDAFAGQIFNKAPLKEFNSLFVTFIAVIITGLLTPLKLSPYTYPFMSIGSVAKEIIAELQFIPSWPFYIILLYVGIILLSSFFIKKNWLVLMSYGMLCFSMIALRNYFITLYILTIIIAICVKFINDKLINKKYYQVICKIPIIVFACLSVVFLFKCHENFSIKVADVDYVSKSLYPVKAVEFIKQNIDYKNANFYTELDWGSYLEFCGLKAFIDSRTEVFCEEFSNGTILKDWWNFSNKKDKTIDDFDLLDNKYNFSYVLCSISPNITGDEEDESISLYDILISNMNYKLIFKDENFALFEQVN